MTVYYEWDVEEVDQFGDVIDHNHFDSYVDALGCFNRLSEELSDDMTYEIVLVRNGDNERSWAYLENGELPESFEDAYGVETAKVPKRFVKEICKG